MKRSIRWCNASIEYHALSRQYLVHNLNSGERRNFSTCPAALRFMGRIHEFPARSQPLAPDRRYEGALRAQLHSIPCRHRCACSPISPRIGN